MSVLSEIAAGGGSVRRRLLLRPRHLPPSVLLGGGVFLLVCLALVLTPWVAPCDPNAQVLDARLAPPSASHLLGTDIFGRDLLSRILYGGRFSVPIAAITLALSTVLGTLVGVVSGRLGGVVDEVVMRTVDVLLAFPDILLALLMVAILGPGVRTVVLALTITGWTPFARLARAMAIEINTRGYIEAARALGCSQRFITLRHVLPNARTPILSQCFVRFGHQLIVVGALSYLGLGVQPPTADWGSMLADGQHYLQQAPVLVVGPGVAIFVTALSVTIAGQGISGRRFALGRPGLTGVPRPTEPTEETAS